MPEPLATWNPARGAWEVPQTESLICGHSELYSETWPSSGTTRSGTAYALPTSAPLTDGSASSSLLPTLRGEGCRQSAKDIHALLPTPNAADGMGGPGNSGRDGGLNLRTAATLLPTPRASDGTNGGPNQRGSSGDLMLPSAVHQLLPTPSVADATGGHARRGGGRGDELLLAGIAVQLLIPTPLSSDAGPRGGTTGYGLRDWSRAVSRGEPTSPPSAASSQEPPAATAEPAPLLPRLPLDAGKGN